jgi:glycosyltransferase involved in cell wall biosynthesis
MISVLVLTKNEEVNLPGCLESVRWCDDVHVFDSYSTDGTTAIARQRGAVVHQRRFDNFAAQRNAALGTVPFKHSWVLILDADERVPADLAREMLEFVDGAPSGVAAGRLRRRDFMYDQWLKHTQMSPYFIRLVRPQKVRYEREINEVLKVDGTIHELSQPFDHHPFARGLGYWLERHNGYSTLEARLSALSRRGETQFSVFKALLGRDFNERRYHQKELFYRLPARPMIRFLYLYVVRMGFLDGYAGFTYAALQGYYEYMIVLKMRELAHQQKQQEQQSGAYAREKQRAA